FTIFFPKADTVPEPVRTEGSTSTAPRGTETILVVEDDATVRDLVREVLQAVGYTVLETADPVAALQMCVTSVTPVSLLLTDVVMPGVSGPRLAELMKSVCPGIKILYLSGYTADALRRHGVDDGAIELLPKPFLPEQLARRVREALDRP
ncbi:MAG TPA: response regulator, partial [Methylomirabilota bacterium]|nr:response regulator [Methylomirabilota bacterium]